MGAESVRLYMTAESGGSYDARPDDNGPAQICVGREAGKWWSIVGVLMHEAMELSLMRHGCRFVPHPDYANDNGSITFIATHTKFSEATATAAMFITESLPPLSKAWAKWDRNRKK
jgi:hypothetical protein